MKRWRTKIETERGMKCWRDEEPKCEHGGGTIMEDKRKEQSWLLCQQKKMGRSQPGHT